MRIKILGKPIEVVRVKKGKKNKGEYGCFHDIQEKIEVRSDLTGRPFKRTLMHEIWHAYMDTSGVSQVLDEKQEEMLCHLAENFIDLIEDRTFQRLMK